MLSNLWQKLVPAERRLAVAALVVALSWPLVLVIAIFAPVWAGGIVALLLLVATGVVAGSLWSALRRRLQSRAVNRQNPQVSGLFGHVIGYAGAARSVQLDGTAGPAGRHLADQLARRTPVEGLIRAGLSSRGRIYRDALALVASGGRFDFDELLVAAPGGLAGPGVDPDALIGLVRLVLGRADQSRHLEALLDLSLPHAGRAAEVSRVALAEALVVADRRDDAAGILGSVRSGGWTALLVEADVLNPFVGGTSREAAPWLAHVNGLFAASGVEPLQLAGSDADGSPFDRLAVPGVAPGSVGGPLVTVVMTSWQPGPECRTAVESVIAQSWRDWELLVVDDGSGPGFDEFYAEIERRDERIRVIRVADNGGTYRRRNDGLDAARGEIVAFHDSDDWSHPRRLEIQVKAMLADRSLLGTVSSALRVSPELEFVQPRGADLRLCEPSFMMWRDRGMAASGYFDAVRRGGDVEYRERSSDAGGEIRYIPTAAPLTLQRFDTASLSNSDFTQGWSHPARLVYRSSHRHWRTRQKAARASLRRERDEVKRSFPAPDRLAGRGTPEHVHDLVLLADVGDGILPAAQLRLLVSALERWGRRGALLPAPALLGSTQETDLHGVVLDAVARAGSGLRSLGEQIHAHVLTADPSVLLALPDEDADALTADQVVIVDLGRSSLDIPREAVVDLVQRRFGVTPSWQTALPTE